MIQRFTPWDIGTNQTSPFSIERTIGTRITISGKHLYARTVKLPDIIVSVSMPAGPSEYGPIRCLTHVVIVKTIDSRSALEVETNRHSLITCFAIECRFHGHQRVVV